MMEGSHGQGTSALLLLLRTRRKARTQHGGRETTLFTIITKLLHFGMAVVFAGQMKVDEITGGAPYGATTIVGLDAQRQPSENELAGPGTTGAPSRRPPRTPRLNDVIKTRQGAGRVDLAIERNGC
jgi:hypothetical protein